MSPHRASLGAILDDLRRAVAVGEVAGREGRHIPLSPTQRRIANHALAELQAIERHNAFVASSAGEPYRTRRNAPEALHDVSPPLKVLVKDRLTDARLANAFSG